MNFDFSNLSKDPQNPLVSPKTEKFSTADAVFASFVGSMESSARMQKSLFFAVLSVVFAAIFMFSFGKFSIVSSGMLFAFSVSCVLFSALFWQTAWWAIAFFAIFVVFSFSFADFSQKISVVLLGTGFFLIGKTLFQSLLNQVEVKIFSTTHLALKSASFVFALAFALFFASSPKAEDFFSSSFLASSEFDVVLDKMLQSEMFSASSADTTALFLKSYEDDIDAMCEGKSECVADTTARMEKMLLEQIGTEKKSGEESGGEESENSEKEQLKAMLKQQLQQKIQSIFRGDFLSEDIKNTVPFPLEKAIPLLIFLMIATPFLAIFSLGLSVFFTIIFYLLFVSGIIKKGRKSVQKETVY